MKTFILTLLILLSWSPYLFLATSVKEVELSDRAYDCTVMNGGRYNKLITLTRVYYNPLEGFLKGTEKIMPLFLLDEQVSYARCGKDEFLIGKQDYAKPGEQVHIFTRDLVINFFGYQISKETDIDMFGSGWLNKTEGETVLVKLINNKEVKMFGGKILK